MSPRQCIVTVALLCVALSAHAGFTSALPESATVTLIFVALAVIGFAIAGKTGESIESSDV